MDYATGCGVIVPGLPSLSVARSCSFAWRVHVEHATHILGIRVLATEPLVDVGSELVRDGLMAEALPAPLPRGGKHVLLLKRRPAVQEGAGGTCPEERRYWRLSGDAGGQGILCRRDGEFQSGVDSPPALADKKPVEQVPPPMPPGWDRHHCRGEMSVVPQRLSKWTASQVPIMNAHGMSGCALSAPAGRRR